MQRRAFLVSGTTLVLGGLAGCIADSNTGGSSPPGNTTTTDETPTPNERQPPEETVRAFFTAVNEDDADTVSSLYTEDAQQDVEVTQDAVAGMEYTVKSMREVTDTDADVEAAVLVEWSADDSSDLPSEGTTVFELQIEEDQWKIQDTVVISSSSNTGQPYGAPYAQIEFDYDRETGNLEILHAGGDHITDENTGVLRMTGVDTAELSGEEWGDGLDSAGGENLAEAAVTADITAGDTIWDSTSAGTDGTITSGDTVVITWESVEGYQTEPLAQFIVP